MNPSNPTGSSLREDLQRRIAVVKDFPEPGISFQDLTPIMADGPFFARVATALGEPFAQHQFDYIFAPESRGFIFGCALAAQRGVGFVPVRKPGKLPRAVLKAQYSMEYGPAGVELHAHQDAVPKGARVLVVDDVLATGGTAAACVELAQKMGATVVGAAFVLEIPSLNGRRKLGSLETIALLEV